MAKLRLGIVGCGSITQRGLLPHLFQEDAKARAQVVALCTRTVSRARCLARHYGIGQVFGDLNAMLSWGELDAVLIASPIALHHEQIKVCLAHGLHVHTQKTLAQTYCDGEALRQLARSKGVVLAASPGQMMLPAYARVQALIHDQRMGSLYSVWGVNVVWGHERDPLVHDPSWYYRPGGGPLEDMGIYNLHALIELLGVPQRVSAMTGQPLAEKRAGNHTVRVKTPDNVCLMMDWGGRGDWQPVDGICL